MKKGLTEIVCILDRSGSMNHIASDAIGGFNAFLNEQKKVEGEANVTVALFSTSYSLLAENEPIESIKELTEDTYRPMGGTSLYDAIGNTISAVGKRLNETDEAERPEKVIVAILTDGEENSSNDYVSEDIKSMIKEQEDKYSWQFVFLAANQDAFDAGSHFGMRSFNSINFNATSKGSDVAFANISSYTTQVRCAKNVTADTMASYVALTEDDVN